MEHRPMDLNDIASYLVHHVHRSLNFPVERMEQDWEYLNDYTFKNLENMAYHVVYRMGYFKFESEVAEIKYRLPEAIQLKPGPIQRFLTKQRWIFNVLLVAIPLGFISLMFWGLWIKYH